MALAALAGEPWLSPHPDTQSAQAQLRACRLVGGFEPDIRHRADDIAIIVALVAARQTWSGPVRCPRTSDSGN